jgi:hypothetical protein
LLPARVCHWRTSRQWGPQVLSNWSVLTGWDGMGPNWQKSLAHPCTRLHMPGHVLHMRGHPQTCLYMPEHACMAVESPKGGTTNDDGGRWQLYLAEFTQEEIAEKGGVDRSLVSRDLQSAHDVCPSGDSPDLEVARLTQTVIRKRGQAPYTLYEVGARYTTSGSKSHFPVSHCVPRRRPHPGTKGGLRPAGRWIRPQLSCKFDMQFNAI